MYAKEITYKDYNGLERKETFLFNLTKTEILEMDAEVNGGLKELLEKIVAANDIKNIMRYFKTIVLKAYGEKSEDGRRFVKSEKLAEAFTQTEAYDIFMMGLLENPNEATAFINAIIPSDTDKSTLSEV